MPYDGQVRIIWTEEDARYIQTRSHRYPGAFDIDPDWTQDVTADLNMVEVTPYPGSREERPGSSATRPAPGGCWS